MDLNTIDMDQDEARRHFEAYRAAVKERHDAEDEAIMRGYKALAEGHQVLNLREAISRGGVDEAGYPRLAVAKANQRWCWAQWSWRGELFFQPEASVSSRRGRASGVFEFPPDTLPRPDFQRRGLRAIVPTVPPPLRPKSLVGLDILWEATWEVVPRPPDDPALLRQISGDLYAVLAVWDLTPLEQAVLGARTL